jgi:DNA-binding NarL/FixJ family response regulator
MVVEDDAFTRLSLVATLASAGMDVTFECDNVRTALTAVTRNLVSVDVALVDLHLGSGPTGLDLAVALRQRQPGIGIVMLTSYDDPRLLHSGLPTAPPGTQYVVKKQVTTIDLLITAINGSTSLAHATAGTGTATTAFGAFSDRQIETLRLVAQGLSNAEIAKRRFVTEKSVELAIARVARALGLPNKPGQNQRVNIAKVYFHSLGVAHDEFR